MQSNFVRQKYLDFFAKRGHKIVPSSSLVPENDPTTLFTGSGMQPMIPYLLGETHPLGRMLTDSQKCFRSQDIEEVGNNRHTTFFEMLGNWSLGDYWKEDQLSWFFKFLTDLKEGLGIDPSKLYVTAFEGNKDIPQDIETINIWQKLFAQNGIEAKLGERIFLYGVEKNWWSRSGVPENMPEGEPGGPDSEVFYDFGLEHNPKFGEFCHPNCDCGRFLEIGNSVFMQYQKQADGSFKELPQKNVDFGGGLERLTAVSAEKPNPDIFQTDLFIPLISKLQETTHKRYNKHPFDDRYFRIIADHVKAAIILISDGVKPSNKEAGYVIRKLLTKAIHYGRNYLFIKDNFTSKLIEPILEIYGSVYPNIAENQEIIRQVLDEEEKRFSTKISKGIEEYKKELKKRAETITIPVDKLLDGKDAFYWYETYGLPLDIQVEIGLELGWDRKPFFEDQFLKEKKKHQELSRNTSAGTFKGGLADAKEKTTKLHTTNHIMQAALRIILGTHVRQHGSNITSERLRYDFSHDQKLTDQEIKQVEDLVNEQIKKDLSVRFDIEDREEAIKNGALTNVGETYPEKVKVYKIGTEGSYFSKELCGGPHVEHTGVIGKFKILKQESLGMGLRRIYATIED